jgi:quinol monooxygenase YgiN
LLEDRIWTLADVTPSAQDHSLDLPARLEDYKALVKEQIETAIRTEPGVLVLYAVAEKNNPTRVSVFEIYRDTDAYKAHLKPRRPIQRRIASLS